MDVVELPLEQIREAPWNPNQMDDAMVAHLCLSVERFGLVVPLVVRRIGKSSYETVGGAQRLSVLQSLGFTHAPCVDRR